MKRWVVLLKEIGETPLEVAERYRIREGLSADIPLAYAGRLDPMAEGKLLILVGDECKNLTEYTGLDKEYVFEVLFGFSSDTGDVLGLATPHDFHALPHQSDLKAVTKRFIGKQKFPYPKFSSKTVQGKPLHTWTLEGRLGEIQIPTKESTVYRLRYGGHHFILKDDLRKKLLSKINSIPKVTDPRKALGKDFRREDIRAKWNEILEHPKHTRFLVATYVCVASSGTYMRTLAEEIGKTLGTGGLAFSIARTEIGRYKSFGPRGFWTRTF